MAKQLHDDDELDRPRLDPFQMRLHHRILGRIIYVVDAIRFWVSWPFVLIGRTVLRGGVDSIHRVEDLLGALRWKLADFWWRLMDRLPFEGLRRRVHTLQEQATRSVDELAQTVQEKTVRAGWIRRTAEAMQRSVQKVRIWWFDLLAAAEQSPVARVLTAPARWITRAVESLIDFAMGWLWTRDFRQLLYGIPALILLLPLAYCAARMPFYSNEAKAKHYRRAVELALEDENYDAANLYFRKLAQLGDTHDRVTLRAAMAEAEQENWEAAYAQLKTIAPVQGDELGALEAHWWIADSIANGRIEKDNPKSQELLLTHLERVLEQRPDSDAVRIWMADIYRESQQTEKAWEMLEPVRTNRLDWPTRSRLADVYARLGQLDRARKEARPITQHLAQQQQDAAELTPQDYVSWASSHEVLGEPAKALDSLVLGTQAHPEHKYLREATERLGIILYDAMPNQSATDWQSRWLTLERLIKAVPDAIELQIRVARLAHHPQIGSEAVAVLQELDGQGKLTPRAVRIQADLAVVSGNRQAAFQLYERTLAADPTEHVALNNLAFLTGDSTPSDLPKALSLVNRAIELEPENPHYYETRGQILFKQQDWAAAVRDLRRALNGMPHKREIHRSLAIACREIGELEAARQHAVLAQQ